MVSPTVELPSGSAATSPSPLAATCLVMSASSPVKALPLATKSVLQLSSTMTPTLPSTNTSTAPSVASRSLSLPALARPLARRMSSARSASPPDSSSAFLQSSIGAPVALRTAAMSLAEYSAIPVLLERGGARGGGGDGLGDRLAGGLSGGLRGRLGGCRLGLGELRLAFALGRRGGVARLLLLGGLRRLLLRAEGLRRRGRGLGGSIRLRAGLRLLARPQPLTLDDRVGEDAAHEVGRTDRVVVPGDDEVDDVGIAVGVDDRDHRDTEAVGLELGDLALDLEAFLLDHLLVLAGRDQPLELVHLGHAAVHGLEVGEHAAEPAVVHVGGVGPLGLLLDRLLGLLLRADEEDRAAV